MVGIVGVYATYNLLYNAAMLVNCGIAAAISIEGAASLYKNPNLIFRPFYPEFSVKSVMVWKRHQPQTAAVSKFIRFVREKIDLQRS